VPAETNKATTLQQSWGLKSPTQQQTTSTSPFTAAAPKQNEQQKSPLTQANGVSTAKPAPSPAQPPTAPKQPTAAPAPASSKLADRYLQIHQELKNLRKNMIAESKKPGSPLKGRLGAFRREIQVSIGQLTAGRGANTKPVSLTHTAVSLSTF
jgi:nucleoporin GLE1